MENHRPGLWYFFFVGLAMLGILLFPNLDTVKREWTKHSAFAQGQLHYNLTERITNLSLRPEQLHYNLTERIANSSITRTTVAAALTERINNSSPTVTPTARYTLGRVQIPARFRFLTYLPEYHIEDFLLPGQRLEDMTDAQAEERFFRLVGRDHMTCYERQRLGSIGAGGWDICASKPYVPQPGLVYSFGINNDFSFDDAMAARYNCQVYSFDPSMHIGDHKHSPRVWFYQLGLGGSNNVNENGWKLETFGTILKKAGHSNKIIEVLKIDIDYGEWVGFEAMFQEESLKNVKQLVFEIHTPHMAHPERVVGKHAYKYMSDILIELERIGFKKHNTNFNPHGRFFSKITRKQRSCCYELSYINVKFLQ